MNSTDNFSNNPISGTNTFINSIDGISNKPEEIDNNNYSSLGSIFDNNPISNNQVAPTEVKSSEGSNIFISNIQKEQSMSNTNQFIPNFETNNASTVGSFNNNFDNL